MKEIPCKVCIIQPVCTQKCNEMLEYSNYLFDIGPSGNSTVFIEYYETTQLILHRRHQTQLTKENKL